MGTVRNTAAIRALFIAGYSRTLVRARKVAKGLRTGHIEFLIIVGTYPQGITCAGLGKLVQRPYSNTHTKLKREVEAGWLVKQKDLYTLSEAGRKVYDTLCAAWNEEYNKLVRSVVKDARARMKD